ncbi:MAG: hemerythrin domain-containing protein [Planctomycetota bacterium]
MSLTAREVDVRSKAPPEQHELVMSMFRGLQVGAAFELLCDHEPRVFYHQLAMEFPQLIGWRRLGDGPPAWRVEVMRLKPKEAETGVAAFFERDHAEIDLLLAFLRQDIQAAIDTRRPTAPLAAQFEEFSNRLDLHLRWEQEALFPAVERKQPALAQGVGRAMRLEHDEIVRLNLLAAKHLREGHPTREGLTQMARAVDHLMQVLAEHNQREANVYYPIAMQLLTSDEAAQVLKRIRELR